MADEKKPLIDYEDYGLVVTNMWATLAQTIHGGIGDIYISDGPEAAIRYAWFAEACYWQARGEDKSPSVHEIIEPPREKKPEEDSLP